MARQITKTILAVFAVAVLATSAFANTQTANMTVQATVISDCTISVSSNLDFGNLGLSFITTDQNMSAGNVAYTCTSGATPAKITISQGSNAAAGSTTTAPLRQMKSAGGGLIRYDLYSTNFNVGVWGDDPTVALSATADGAAHTATVYGVARHANVPAGSYSDTVVVTITF